MATNPYTTTYLLASLKRRGMLPSNANTLTTADFLAFANDELLSYVAPLMLDSREEYFERWYDQSIVSGQVAYALPPRAMFGGLKSVHLSNSAGAYTPLLQTTSERSGDYASTGGQSAFYLKGNYVMLTPTPSNATASLRMIYFERPNRQVETTAVALITAINTGTKVLTLQSTIPATFLTTETYDLVKGTPGFDNLGIDLVATAASGTSMTFSATLPTGLAVGDYVCLAGESPIPQVPVELHPLLAQRIVVRAFFGQDDGAYVSASREADRMRKDALDMISPRVTASGKVILNRYGPGFNRRRR